MDPADGKPLDAPSDCPLCGARGVGGLEGCRATMGSLGAREFADPAFFRVHRLSVDAYSLQHPEDYMRSSKSAAAHLAGMCWSMERGRSTHLPAPVRAWVDGPRRYERLSAPPPQSRGELTVVSVLGASDARDYEQRVFDWARSAWGAWSVHHEKARAWVQEALHEYERQRATRSR